MLLLVCARHCITNLFCAILFTGLGVPPTSLALSHVPILGSIAPSTTTLTSSLATTLTSSLATTPITSAGVMSLLSAATTPKLSPFILASAIPPIPGKVVQKVAANEFVDLRELLPDNVSLLEKLEGLPVAPGSTRPRLREVSSLLTWCICMLKLIALQAENADKARQICGYACLVIQEARKHGGDGWCAYDQLFRQHAAAKPDLPWATLDGSIHAATILASRTGTGTHCRLCAESDHLAQECALAPILNHSQPIRFAQHNQMSYRRPLPAPVNVTRPICNSWNRGKCAYAPVCSYRHICASCQEQHQAKDCAHTPLDSIFRRPPLPPRHGNRGPIGS